MPLFQKSVVNKYLSNLDSKTTEEYYQNYLDVYGNSERIQNIIASKEEQYQEGFLRDIFVNVLGYTINPDPSYNLTTEFKNLDDAKKADGAILINGSAIGVIELKSTKTKKLEDIKNQAFNYKNHQPGCKYVITSNFEKLWLYIEDATEHEEFNLFDMSRQDFELFHLFLCKDSILGGIPLKMKQDSKLHEENISKKLYKDYSDFKRKIFDNLVENNPDIDKLTLLQKSQKILDRLLFIFFAEDKGLIPPNTISKIIEDYEQLKELDAYQPLFNIFTKYFNYIDVGYSSQRVNIDGYNGELFKPDALLESLVIDDEVLINDTINLSKYDFDTEVDVNILGHIFEHSLNEIEALQAEIRGEEFKSQTSKRKKDGVYYTPKYITKYIVENTLGKLCEDKKKELDLLELELDESLKYRKSKIINKELQDTLDKLMSYREFLLSLKICDPACGSGAFLNQALEYLIKEHSFVDENRRIIEKDAMGLFNIEQSILENNIYGVDINEEAVEIAKLSLWLRTAQRGRKLSSLNTKIKCGNSLIDDPEVAGDKAFNWAKEFPEVFPEKKLEAFHVTWSTKNSRISEKMIRAHAKTGDPVVLTEEMREIAVRAIEEKVIEEKFRMLALNVLQDHVHILLVCDKKDLEDTVRKLKGYSSYSISLQLELSVAEGGRQTRIWARSFSDTNIRDENHLYETMKYIQNNHLKHDHTPTRNRGLNEHSNRGLQPSAEDTNTPTAKAVGCGDAEDTNTPTAKAVGCGDAEDTNTPTAKAVGCGDAEDTITPTAKAVGCGDAGAYTPPDQAFAPEHSGGNAKNGNATGGFDVVIGNPPYGAKLSKEVQKYLNSIYISGGSETAISFIKLSHSLLSEKGMLGFIIPKSFSYASNYKAIREFVFDDITQIIDCKKVWKEVKLEQVILHFIKNNQLESYKSGILEDEQIKIIGEIDKNTFHEFGFFLNGISGQELKIAKKMILCQKVLNDIAVNSRGGIFQKFITKDQSDFKVLGGAEIQRYGIVGLKGYIRKEIVEKDDKSRIKDNSVLVQNIVAHIEKPIDHIKITSYCTDCNDCTDYRIVDTINQISVNNDYSDKFIWGLLNSDLLNWFVYRFIFGKAIRTMHFDNSVTSRLPIPDISLSEQQPFIEKADIMLERNKELHTAKEKFLNFLLSKFDIDKPSKKLQDWHLLSTKEFLKELAKKKVKLSLEDEMAWTDLFESKQREALAIKEVIDRTDREIDRMVYELYGLTEEEIAIVEGE